jgi:hypothetical protein
MAKDAAIYNDSYNSTVTALSCACLGGLHEGACDATRSEGERHHQSL